MVRDPASAADLAATGAELAVADLGRPGTLDGALEGVEAVVATANAVAPIRRSDSAAMVDVGYAGADPTGRARRRPPVRPRQRAGDPAGPGRAGRPLQAAHRAAPGRLRDVVAVAAHAAVLRGLAGARRQRDPAARRAADDAGPRVSDPAPVPAGHRPHDRTAVGVMVVPGPPSARQAFLSVHDAAAGLAAAVRSDTGEGPVDLGGPRIAQLGRCRRDLRAGAGPTGARRQPARRRCSPPGSGSCTPVAPALAGVLGLNRLIATSETDWDTADTAARSLGLHSMRTVEEILRNKAALPPIR